MFYDIPFHFQKYADNGSTDLLVEKQSDCGNDFATIQVLAVENCPSVQTEESHFNQAPKKLQIVSDESVNLDYLLSCLPTKVDFGKYSTHKSSLTIS